VLALDGPDLDRFVTVAAEALAKDAPGPMLSAGICANYRNGVTRLQNHKRVSSLAGGMADAGSLGSGALFQVTAQDFLAHPELSEEVFGPSSLMVRCRDLTEMKTVLKNLDGQLTATLQLDAQDHAAAAQILPLLERKIGRILVNGWPTGVEVSPAMVHGGPFPATSDSRATSVGTLAIERFLRPVCYQDLPDDLLAPELRDENPLHLRRLIDGRYASP